MKNPLQTLLMLLALALCGFCTWQWYGQVLQRKEMTELAQANYDQAMAIQGYTNSINRMDGQIGQLDVRISELRDTIKSNNVVIFGLREENGRLNLQTDQYSNALVTLHVQIQQANESIVRQNEALKSLVAERDEFVNRLNETIKERNEIVGKFNDLVKRVEEMQAAQSNKTQKSKSPK